MAVRLIVLRHAKSAWPVGVRDLQRPLSPRGQRDAPAAGRWIRDHVGVPDAVVVSPAVRTQQTWHLVRRDWPHQPAMVRTDPRVYEAAVTDVMEVIADWPPTIETGLVIGHNPGLDDLVCRLAGVDDVSQVVTTQPPIAKFATSAIAVVTAEVSWQQLLLATPAQSSVQALHIARG